VREVPLRKGWILGSSKLFTIGTRMMREVSATVLANSSSTPFTSGYVPH